MLLFYRLKFNLSIIKRKKEKTTGYIHTYIKNYYKFYYNIILSDDLNLII